MIIKSAWHHMQNHARGIMRRRHSLQEQRGVRMSRCEMWAQAVGEIHFLGLHRDDRQTDRKAFHVLGVANSRWQLQSDKLASNRAGLRRSLLVTVRRNICLYQLCEIP